jgi:uncharacterized protein YunC (DUF1805 family)
MAKITRKYNKTFGDTGPTGILGQWGSYKGGTGVYSSDPDTLQALTSEFAGGLKGGMNGNAPPAIEELNGLFYLLSRQGGYLLQTGIPEWDAATEYHTGSFVSVATDGAVYMSVADSNTNNAVSDTTKWMIYDSKKITAFGATIANSGFMTLAYNDVYVVCTDVDTDAAATVGLVTAVAANSGRRVTIKNLVATAKGGTRIDLYSPNTGDVDGRTTFPAGNGGGTAFYLTKLGDYATLISNGSKWLIVDCNAEINLLP